MEPGGRRAASRRAARGASSCVARLAQGVGHRAASQGGRRALGGGTRDSIGGHASGRLLGGGRRALTGGRALGAVARDLDGAYASEPAPRQRRTSSYRWRARSRRWPREVRDGSIRRTGASSVTRALTSATAAAAGAVLHRLHELSPAHRIPSSRWKPSVPPNAASHGFDGLVAREDFASNLDVVSTAFSFLSSFNCLPHQT